MNMKSYRILFTFLLLFLFFIPVANCLTPAMPPIYNIESAKDLQKIGNEWPLDGLYLLTNDIEIIETEWKCIGSNGRPFTGSFNGNGHTIRFKNDVSFMQAIGPNINESSNGYGFFGNIYRMSEHVGYYGGEFKNIIVIYQGNINNRHENNIGGFVGIVSNSSTASPRFENCSIIFENKTLNGNNVIGGFAGYVKNAFFSNCSVISDVKSNQYAGGFIGYVSYGNFSNCSVTGSSCDLIHKNVFFGGFSNAEQLNLNQCFLNEKEITVDNILNSEPESEAKNKDRRIYIYAVFVFFTATVLYLILLIFKNKKVEI